MLRRAWHHLGPIAGLLALFIALGGPAWAADKIDGKSIKAATVTGKQVKNSSLTGADVRDGTLTGADALDGSLTGADLAAGTLSGTQLADGGVGAADLAPGSVGTTQLADGGVRTVDLAPDVVAPTALALPGLRTTRLADEFAVAGGRRAVADDAGSFVWADSTDADFSSTTTDQFAIRAGNGVLIAANASDPSEVPIGTRFRDNSVVAWGRVTAGGTLDSGVNVASITKIGTGHYKVNLGAGLQSGFSLVPVVSPEVDEAGGNVPPTGAANVRLAVTNQFASGTNFDVYVYNGSFASVDNDFHFVVTGR